MEAIILAAGVGRRLENVWHSAKCLIDINGETLLERSARILSRAGIKPITVVVGFNRETVIKTIGKLQTEGISLRFVYNENYERGSLLSLLKAEDRMLNPVLIIDADLYYHPSLVEKIVTSNQHDFFAIDSKKGDEEAVIVGFDSGRAIQLGRGLEGNYEVKGEWAGFLRFSATGANELLKVLKKYVELGKNDIGYEFVVPDVFNTIPVGFELIDESPWIEIDFPQDIAKARALQLMPLKL